MTQLQKIAWLNLLFFPLLAVILILPEVGVWSRTTQHILLGVLMATVLIISILMAKMPWHKGEVVDERDRRFRQRSFSTAYLVLMGCLSVGLPALIIAFPGREIPLKFVVGGICIACMASVLGQSVAVLIQYKTGIRENP